MPDVKKYRNKPLEVEAFQWDGTPVEGYMDFSNNGRKSLAVWTKGGVKHASVGDYIVNPDSGNTQVMTASEFEKMYEPA